MLTFVNLPAQQTENPFSMSQTLLTEKTLIPTERSTTRSGFPPIWNTPITGGSTMAIVLKVQSNPRVNNFPLELYDYIGGFYYGDFGQLKCGGAAYWPDSIGVVFSLLGDNMTTPEKDGFAYQELIHFRLFSWDRMKDYEVDVLEFAPGSLTTDIWYPMGISEVVNIQALEVFDFYITATENPICIGGGVTLSANEFIGTNGNYSYIWSSTPPGFSSTLPNPPAHYPNQNIIYNLTVNDGTYTSQPTFPIVVNQYPTVAVGQGGLICENQNFTVSGSATNYTTTLWTTNGDGYFVHPTYLETVYKPGENDITSGEAILTFTAFPLSPCTMSTSDVVMLNIQEYPQINAGNDLASCKSESSSVLVEASGANIGSLQWTTGGDGTFSSTTTLGTVYYPGTMDWYYNLVKLTVCAQAQSPCVMQTCDDVNISFVMGPSCNAPTNITRCEDVAVNLAGNASNHNGTVWTTQGDGTFDNPAVINTKYNAGPNDRQNGGTVITLNALPFSPCVFIATKNVNIILKPLPRLTTFGANTNFLCPGENFLQLNAQLAYYNSFGWSTLGDGSFTSTTALNPKYYPGSQDFINGYFELKLTATPLTPCTTTTQFVLHTTIATQPEANILTPNGSAFCGEANLWAETFMAASVSWQTNGDGTFSNPQIVQPVYYPGTADLNNTNPVTLIITATPLCTGFANDQSSVQLYFMMDATANAGADATICSTNSFGITNASANHYENIAWSTSGNGYFDNPGDLYPTYFPGTQDILNGQTTLTLTAFSMAPCNFTASDNMLLTIQNTPSANAGLDQTGCEEFVLSATATAYNSLLWLTSGDGTFAAPFSSSTTYYPGINDFQNMTVNLQLHANPIAPCTVATIDELTLTLAMPEIIEDQVIDKEVMTGQTLMLAFILENTGSGNFLWYKNDELIEYENSPSYLVNNTSPADAGFYQCRFVNACGLIESNEALVQVLEPLTQLFDLKAGWQGVSSYLEPDNPDLTGLFLPVGNQLIILLGNQGIYWPEQTINTLGLWSDGTGYCLKMADDAQLLMNGVVRYPKEPTTILPGWSYFPVHSGCQVNVQDLLTQYPQIAIVEDLAGTKMYYPAYGINTLIILLPGKSYKIYNTSGVSFTIDFPECE